MKKLFTLILFVSSTLCTQAQAPPIEWKKSYGSINGFDQANAIHQTFDGGYIAAGYTSGDSGDITGFHHNYTGTGEYDQWVLKTNAAGVLTWEICLGDRFVTTIANGVQQTRDSGFIVAGTATDSYDFSLINKLSSSGVVQWTKSYRSGLDLGTNAIQQTKDGGFILAGYADSVGYQVSRHFGARDYSVIKLDDTGAVQWEHSYGGSGEDQATAIVQTTDGGYIVAGMTNSTDGDVTGMHATYWHDYWIVKIDSVGTMEWQKALGGTFDDIPGSIQQTTDGGYIVAGASASNNGDVTGYHQGPGENPDYWVVKLTSAGTIDWEKTYGGAFNDAAAAIEQTADGGYVVAGTTNSNDGDVTGVHGTANHDDYWLIKISSTGTLQWQQTYGGIDYDRCYAMCKTANNGLMLAGNGSSHDGDLAGGKHGGYWLIKLSGLTGVANLTAENNISIYPNPATTQLVINNEQFKSGLIEIQNILGEALITRVLSTDQQKAYIDIHSLPAGVYMCILKSNEQVAIKKFVKE